jgi:hypothetical protein
MAELIAPLICRSTNSRQNVCFALAHLHAGTKNGEATTINYLSTWLFFLALKKKKQLRSVFLFLLIFFF